MRHRLSETENRKLGGEGKKTWYYDGHDATEKLNGRYIMKADLLF